MPLLIVAENNATRTDHSKARIEKDTTNQKM